MTTVSPIEKIRRLLRLGRSPNRHEAELAMAKAAELAMKHQIDLANVKADEERERLAHEWFGCRARYNDVERYALGVVIATFPVNAVSKHEEVAFIGTPSAIESARWALGFLIECAARELKAWRKEQRGTGRRPTRSAERNFLQGWHFGVRRQVEKQREATPELMDARNAIILADQEKERDSYVTENMTDRKERQRTLKSNPTAFFAGAAAGLRTKLNRPIEGAREQLRLTA